MTLRVYPQVRSRRQVRPVREVRAVRPAREARPAPRLVDLPACLRSRLQTARSAPVSPRSRPLLLRFPVSSSCLLLDGELLDVPSVSRRRIGTREATPSGRDQRSVGSWTARASWRRTESLIERVRRLCHGTLVAPRTLVVWRHRLPGPIVGGDLTTRRMR